MSMNRVDGWSDEEEQMLAHIILRMIRNGGTQSSAFQEAGQKLKRTPTACCHRWNRLLRRNYAAQIEDAKSEWSKQIEQIDNKANEHENEEKNVSTSQNSDLELLIWELSAVNKTIQTKISDEDCLSKEIRSLREELVSLTAELTKLQNDYRFILNVLKNISTQILQGKHTI